MQKITPTSVLSELLLILKVASIDELRDNTRLCEHVHDTIAGIPGAAEQTLANKATMIRRIGRHYREQRASDVHENTHSTAAVINVLDRISTLLDWAHPQEMLEVFQADIDKISDKSVIDTELVQKLTELIQHHNNNTIVLIPIVVEHLRLYMAKTNKLEQTVDRILFNNVINNLFTRLETDNRIIHLAAESDNTGNMFNN